MIKLNIQEAKTHLSEYLERVEQGETIVLCRRNKPVAEIRRLAQQPTGLRPIGVGVGDFEIPESFFAPLPDDRVDAFWGEAP